MRIVFMGTPQAAVPSLERCVRDGHEVVSVWTQPDKPTGRGHRLAQSEVKHFAMRNSLSIEQPKRIRNPETIELFASFNADVAVVVAYGKILPDEFLTAPRRGCINVHFSLLPKYRGAAPVNWAIINGEQSTGVTTMFIEKDLDSGPILLQRSTDISVGETAPELMSRLSITGAELLGETLQRLDQLTPIPQQHSQATYAPLLKKEDGLIDWSMSAPEIERRVRGLQPWPNSFTHFRGQRLTIFKAIALESVAGGDAGQVIESDSSQLIVKCGANTALRLLEVQPESKRRMNARDFYNGTQPRIGESFV